MDKFIWALTWSDPYLDIDIKKKKERIHQDLDDGGLLGKINELIVERIELHQERNKMLMNIMIHSP